MRNFASNQISLIYKHQNNLKRLLMGKFEVFGQGSDKTYIGIRNYHYRGSSDKIIERSDLEQKIIFIDGGIWQYGYLNKTPSNKEYYSAETFINDIVKVIRSTPN